MCACTLTHLQVHLQAPHKTAVIAAPPVAARAQTVAQEVAAAVDLEQRRAVAVRASSLLAAVVDLEQMGAVGKISSLLAVIVGTKAAVQRHHLPAPLIKRQRTSKVSDLCLQH